MSMNKTILSLILLLPFAFLSCGNDDEPQTEANGISIVESQLFFPSQGGVGSVVVAADGPVTVSLDADWCEATVNGNNIQLAAVSNPTIEGRSAILCIHSGQSTTQLTVQQRGIVYRFDHAARYIYGDTAATASLPISYDNETSVTSDASWLTVTLEADTLRYTCTENTSGSIRSSWIKVRSGAYADSLKVVQYDVQKDILGNYCLAGTAANGSLIEYTGKLAYTGRTLYLRLNEQNWNIPVQFDEQQLGLAFSNGQYIGRWRDPESNVNYYVSTLVTSLVEGNYQITYSATYGTLALLDYDPEMQTTVGRFGDDGSWAATGLVPNAILIWLSTARTLSSGESAGYLSALNDPYIYKIKD